MGEKTITFYLLRRCSCYFTNIWMFFTAYFVSFGTICAIVLWGRERRSRATSSNYLARISIGKQRAATSEYRREWVVHGYNLYVGFGLCFVPVWICAFQFNLRQVGWNMRGSQPVLLLKIKQCVSHVDPSDYPIELQSDNIKEKMCRHFKLYFLREVLIKTWSGRDAHPLFTWIPDSICVCPAESTDELI